MQLPIAVRFARTVIFTALPGTGPEPWIGAGPEPLARTGWWPCSAPITRSQAKNRLGLLVRPLPVELPRVPVILARHHRYDSDPAHAWLRDRVRDALRTTLNP